MSRAITASTLVAGVVGHPARHSLSPVIHNAWIEAAALDAVYLAFEPPQVRFEHFVNGLRGGTVLGLNVTTPYKERAFSLADAGDEVAEAAMAANLLLFQPAGPIEARSTDGAGLIGALKAVSPKYASAPAVILGAGGAARSAVLALLHDSASAKVRIVNRSPARAKGLVDSNPKRVSAYGWPRAAEALAGAGVIINATTLGMHGHPPMPLDLQSAPEAAVVMDMVYHPLSTPLLERARAAGRPTVDGLDMLIGQAIPSFEALFGRPPPAEVDVRALCEAALAARP